jgi:hypothetical protein
MCVAENAVTVRASLERDAVALQTRYVRQPVLEKRADRSAGRKVD